jgi:hypothetical protein
MSDFKPDMNMRIHPRGLVSRVLVGERKEQVRHDLSPDTPTHPDQGYRAMAPTLFPEQT